MQIEWTKPFVYPLRNLRLRTEKPGELAKPNHSFSTDLLPSDLRLAMGKRRKAGISFSWAPFAVHNLPKTTLFFAEKAPRSQINTASNQKKKTFFIF